MIDMYGRIEYKISKNHPDVAACSGWTPETVFAYEDVYRFPDSLIDDMQQAAGPYMAAVIKRDLALVAGGGYNSDHITDVKYTIHKA